MLYLRASSFLLQREACFSRSRWHRDSQYAALSAYTDEVCMVGLIEYFTICKRARGPGAVHERAFAVVPESWGSVSTADSNSDLQYRAPLTRLGIVKLSLSLMDLIAPEQSEYGCDTIKLESAFWELSLDVNDAFGYLVYRLNRPQLPI